MHGYSSISLRAYQPLRQLRLLLLSISWQRRRAISLCFHSCANACRSWRQRRPRRWYSARSSACVRPCRQGTLPSPCSPSRLLSMPISIFMRLLTLCEPSLIPLLRNVLASRGRSAHPLARPGGNGVRTRTAGARETRRGGVRAIFLTCYKRCGYSDR